MAGATLVHPTLGVGEAMTPCAGDAYEQTMSGPEFPTKLCYWCRKSVANGGKCGGVKKP